MVKDIGDDEERVEKEGKLRVSRRQGKRIEDEERVKGSGKSGKRQALRLRK